jgi:hypothetical protein
VAHSVGSKMSALVPLLVFKRTFGQQPRLTTAHPWKSARRKNVFSSPFAGAPKTLSQQGPCCSLQWITRASPCSHTPICAGKRKCAISTSAPSAAATRPPGPSGTSRQARRSGCASIDSRIQRFDRSAGTATRGSSRPNNSRCTWQAKSQQLRDCQAQGSPISGARIFYRRVMDHHHRPM